MQPQPEDAVVVSIGDVEVNGARRIALAVRFGDGRIERAELVPSDVPDGIAAGSSVVVVRAALYRRWRVRLGPGA